ncbi:MAG: ABC transporter ATP-binding protein [Minwuia sp.]|uniref:ABC transporter ATP-binding protein n=1 Tax=Minwuia sp. TaxID=2493630 RepID=UPI003A8A38A0
MTRLRFTDVTHRFGDVKAVDGLTLEIGEGEILCLLGPSGCGKTTSLRLAAGLEDLQAGSIGIDGVTVAEPGRSAPPEARRIGMVFQDYALFPHLSVTENVGFGLKSAAASERKRRVETVLARVGLPGIGAKYPHQLSGGEQQRIALARALAPEPGLMLMDEPFANLDVTLRNAVRDETLSVLKQAGASVLLVTHDPEEAMRMADRIAVMQAGRIVQIGTPEDVYLKPANLFMARFFGVVNELTGEVKDGAVSTVLGRFPADAPDGGATVVIRPEAMDIDITGSTCRIEETRLVGAYWRVVATGPDGEALRLRTAARPPAAGASVSVTIDPERMILFPVSP